MTPRIPFITMRRAVPLALALLLPAQAHAAAADADTLADAAMRAPAAPTPFHAPAVPGAPGPGLLQDPGHGLVRADRLVHASLAMALGVGVGIATREPAAGAGTAVSLALAKELFDHRFDRGDLAAGVLGAGLAWLIVAAIDP